MDRTVYTACLSHHTPITRSSLPICPLQRITKYNLILMSLQVAQCDINYTDGLYSFIIFKDTLVNQSLLKFNQSWELKDKCMPLFWNTKTELHLKRTPVRCRPSWLKHWCITLPLCNVNMAGYMAAVSFEIPSLRACKSARCVWNTAFQVAQ